MLNFCLISAMLCFCSLPPWQITPQLDEAQSVLVHRKVDHSWPHHGFAFFRCPRKYEYPNILERYGKINIHILDILIYWFLKNHSISSKIPSIFPPCTKCQSEHVLPSDHVSTICSLKGIWEVWGRIRRFLAIFGDVGPKFRLIPGVKSGKKNIPWERPEALLISTSLKT